MWDFSLTSNNNNSGKKCYYCGKEGHFKRNCGKRIQDEEQRDSKDGEADIVEHIDDVEVLIASTVLENNEWILDTGCTFHMCSRKNWFEYVTPLSGGNVLLGNKCACPITRIGNIWLRMFDGITRLLKDVRFVLELKEKSYFSWSIG